MLDQFSLSAFLTSRDGAGLLRRFARVRLGKGAPLVGEALDAGDIFVVVSGRVRASLARDAREITLFHLDPGDIFSLHSGCTLTTAAASEIRVVGRDAFRALLADHPMLALGMMAVLGRVLGALTRTVDSLVFDDVRQRLARLLLDQPAPRDAGATRALSVVAISRRIGASRQAASAALNDLIRDGVIRRVGRGSYVVTDGAGLARAAAGPAGPRDAQKHSRSSRARSASAAASS